MHWKDCETDYCLLRTLEVDMKLGKFYTVLLVVGLIVGTLLFLGVFSSVFNPFEKPKYAIDTTNQYTAQTSMVHRVNEGVYHPSDYYKIYHFLNAIVETEGSIEAYLDLFDIPYYYEPLSDSHLYQVKTNWVYNDFDSNGLYTAGFNHEYEEKKLVLSYVPFQEEYINAGEARMHFELRCPDNWSYVLYYEEAVECEAQESKVYSYARYDSEQLKVVEGSFFIRYFNSDQTQYGFSENYQPFFSFDYRSPIPWYLGGSVVLPNMTLTLIDNDKLIVFWGDNQFFINRNFHYNRNVFNIEFDNNIETMDYSTSPAFFHQLAEYTGDQTNLDNLKVTVLETVEHQGINILDSFPDASSEVVYQWDGEVYTIVESPLNMGSFNFADARLSLSHNVTNLVLLHYVYDVYPYMVWGNARNDTSTVRERLIWDQASLSIGRSHLRTYRGRDLYTHPDTSISDTLLKRDLLVDEIIDLLQKRLS